VGVEVVLHEHGNAVEWSPDPTGLPFGVQLAGDGLGIGIEFHHRSQGGTLTVQLLDATEVGAGEGEGGMGTGGEAVLKLGEGGLL
jgi:hypothetical protein